MDCTHRQRRRDVIISRVICPLRVLDMFVLFLVDFLFPIDANLPLRLAVVYLIERLVLYNSNVIMIDSF